MLLRSVDDVELKAISDEVRSEGVSVIHGLLDSDFITSLSSSLTSQWTSYKLLVDDDRRSSAGEKGIIRALPALDRVFLQFASAPEILKIVDSLVSPTAILHLGNGFVLLPSEYADDSDLKLFQATWHRDFPRNVSSKLLSVNIFVPLTRTSLNHGATEFLVGSHASDRDLEEHLGSRPVGTFETVEGDIIVFDSTIWHRAGPRDPTQVRLAMNFQFTHHWIKPQIDHSRLIGYDSESRLSEPERRVLGFDARVPADFSEFYRPNSERLYKAGQG